MGGGVWATSSRGAFFRERHGHVAARHAEVVGAVRAVVVGAVALCGRGGEGEEGGRMTFVYVERRHGSFWLEGALHKVRRCDGVLFDKCSLRPAAHRLKLARLKR